ncbi:leukocyte receptor cluster member 8 homolog isoform X2 [Stegodyphus dumicola]|nr:leukocyte receptor cluster member 8 homolog isoform X2 [Stegodyphus dumicola]
MMNSSPYFMNSMPITSQPPVTLPSAQMPKPIGTDAAVEETNSENTPVSNVTVQPPPPPPPPPSSTPSPSSENNNFCNGSSKQAPGSGGIKFTLPKKKIQNKNFQSNREVAQERINNFRSYTESSSANTEEDANVPLHPNILQQKSVSTMAQDSWPPSLKNYVNECFRKCKNDFDKDQVEIILKGKLIRAYNDGIIYTKDWDLEPLPSIHSERMEIEQNTSSTVKNQHSKMNSNSKANFQHRNRNYSYRSRSRSHSRSYSRSRSRSRSRTPPRKVVRRKRHSSSSDSSDDSRGSRRTLSSSIIGPADLRNSRNNNFSKNKKKKKKGNKMSFTVDPEYTTDERLLKRAARFEVKTKRRPNDLVFTISNPFVIDESGADIEWGSDAIIGTCLDLEKPFLRLTGAVDPASVRPVEVLMKSLTMVKKHWVENQDYHFVCEQLKSIRQDLVVQCIRNSFTVQVYETHARIALEKGDHTEFNQCQSQLKALYQEVDEGNRLEFTGYHILYTIYTENTLEMKNILAELQPDDKSDEVVSHAIKIAKTWSSNNYHRFFKLYISAPKMSAFIIDWFIERIRKAALKAIIKS